MTQPPARGTLPGLAESKPYSCRNSPREIADFSGVERLPPTEPGPGLLLTRNGKQTGVKGAGQFAKHLRHFRPPGHQSQMVAHERIVQLRAVERLAGQEAFD